MYLSDKETEKSRVIIFFFFLKLVLLFNFLYMHVYVGLQMHIIFCFTSDTLIVDTINLIFFNLVGRKESNFRKY